MIQEHYVWEWPVRITHWVNFISIIVLSVTGFYIGAPFVDVPSTSQFVMGWMRAIHFAFGYAFALSILVRFIWGFVGNPHCRWWPEFLPWLTRKGWKNIRGTFLFYTFWRRLPPHVVGHNALAAIAYSVIYVLCVVQIVTGFALYGQFAPHGVWNGILNPVLTTFGPQGVRLTHHVIMWLLLGFAIHHIYSAWLMDVKERCGTISSIFSGNKFIESEDV